MQEEVSDELASIKTTEFRNGTPSKSIVLPKLMNTTTILTLLASPSGRNDMMQKRFLKTVVAGAESELHADKGGSQQVSFQGYVESLFVSVSTNARHNNDPSKTIKRGSILYV